MDRLAAPSDQAILDEYFSLTSRPSSRPLAWLMGMCTVYGVKPEQLKGFSWQAQNKIKIPSKKYKLSPLHPQWVLLFQLNGKTYKIEKIEEQWKKGIEEGQIRLSLFDLLHAYKNRKNFYRKFS